MAKFDRERFRECLREMEARIRADKYFGLPVAPVAINSYQVSAAVDSKSYWRDNIERGRGGTN